MIVALADTHAILWHLFGDPKLSSAAKELLDASAPDRLVAVSSVTCIEIVYLEEKGRISPAAFATLSRAIAAGVFAEIPVDGRVARCMRLVSRDDVPDMPDRIISATAAMLTVPLITCDARIRGTSVPTVW